MNAHCAKLPAESLQVYSTVVSPIGNVLPVVWLCLTKVTANEVADVGEGGADQVATLVVGLKLRFAGGHVGMVKTAGSKNTMDLTFVIACVAISHHTPLSCMIEIRWNERYAMVSQNYSGKSKTFKTVWGWIIKWPHMKPTHCNPALKTKCKSLNSEST